MPYVADFDPTTPSIARVYDYFLGGRDNFAADRGLAQRLPLLPPGVADARSWRPGWPRVSVPPEREGEMIVGVAEVP